MRSRTFDISELSSTTNLLRLGALADERRRRESGDRVTFVRVLEVRLDEELDSLKVPDTAGEVRIVGCSDSIDNVVQNVLRIASLSNQVPVTGFRLEDLVSLCAHEPGRFERLLSNLKQSGLARVAEVSIDSDIDVIWIERCVRTGLPINTAVIQDSVLPSEVLANRIKGWNREYGIQAFSPLPMNLSLEPTTGYKDVHRVALARVLVDNIPSIQVDWRLYGPKLAQVALAFGANDVDRVSPFDTLEDGRRRGPLEEINKNIQAASLEPVQRNCHFEITPIAP
ncbi:MAG: hypothetical protein Ct9H300mP25_08170 [Acidobacteriota bacterium]|nr:MAG: hypothetical protein Ct9H300mP25_08170 [Acidobacteriota bacterium]